MNNYYITISADTFFDENVCDAVRETATMSRVSINEAESLLGFSKDVKRDTEIIIKLSNYGYGYITIARFLDALNS